MTRRAKILLLTLLLSAIAAVPVTVMVAAAWAGLVVEPIHEPAQLTHLKGLGSVLCTEGLGAAVGLAFVPVVWATWWVVDRHVPRERDDGAR